MFKKYISEVFTGWVGYFSGIGGIVFTGLCLYFDSKYFQFLFSSLALICYLVAGYRAWKIEFQKVEGFEDYLKPKVKISCHQEDLGIIDNIRTLRIRVTNISGVTVGAAEAKLNNEELPLWDYPTESKCSIVPGDFYKIDAVKQILNNQIDAGGHRINTLNGSVSEICYVARPGNTEQYENVVDADFPKEFDITVRGHNMQPVTETFILSLDANRILNLDLKN